MRRDPPEVFGAGGGVEWAWLVIAGAYLARSMVAFRV
jgi:hypothetical protein